MVKTNQGHIRDPGQPTKRCLFYEEKNGIPEKQSLLDLLPVDEPAYDLVWVRILRRGIEVEVGSEIGKAHLVEIRGLSCSADHFHEGDIETGDVACIVPLCLQVPYTHMTIISAEDAFVGGSEEDHHFVFEKVSPVLRIRIADIGVLDIGSLDHILMVGIENIETALNLIS